MRESDLAEKWRRKVENPSLSRLMGAWALRLGRLGAHPPESQSSHIAGASLGALALCPFFFAFLTLLKYHHMFIYIS